MVFEIYGIEHTEEVPVIRWAGAPTYHGVYLKPSYLEFREIASPVLIDWKVGDYVVYTRTGYTYKLYNIPQPTKKAASNGCGESFVYSNVQFYADTKQLEICPFRDLVYRDSAYYFSTLNAVSTYENVTGIALRIKKNLWEHYGDNSWDVVVAGNLPAELNAGEAREFTVSGGSCLDALDQVYSVWPGLGWTFSVVDDVPTITIGGANVRTTLNTTNLFQYGYEHGLTMIKRTQSNLDTFCTRLYAYGSSRNMVSRYYNDLLDENGEHIYQHENVYIPNLMLPFHDDDVDVWGTTQGLYDASKACLSNEDAIELYGVIPKTIYFDGTEDEEIYPSIAKATINDVRAALSPDDPYYPQAASSSRVDQVSAVLSQPTDSGLIGQGGSKYVEEADVMVSDGYEEAEQGQHETILECEYKLVEHEFDGSGIANITFQDTVDLQVRAYGAIPDSVSVVYHIKSGDAVLKSGRITMEPDEYGTIYTGLMPQLTVGTKEYPVTGTIEVWLQAEVNFPEGSEDIRFYLANNGGNSHWGLQAILTNTFRIKIPQIGFDMMARAALSGTGNPVIAFTDGMLVGRSFTVKSATFDSYNDAWVLEVYRGEDSSVGMMYPNVSYPVAVGDHFVLLDIAMPDSYVGMAENRLLAAAKAKLAELSRIRPFYEPSVDAEQVLKNLLENPDDETYVLREGKYMHITDEDVVLEDEYVIIDTLVINENESNIPTYKVTLRERKKESFQQSIESSIKSLTSVANAASKQTAPTGGGGGGMTDEERTILLNLDSWFGKDPNGRIYVKKDESGSARDFYGFGEVTGGGITASTGGVAPTGMRAILIDSQPYINSDVQTALDICAGSNITITKNGNGKITIASTGGGGGSSVTWGSTGEDFTYLSVNGDSRKLITAHQDISNKITSPSTSGATGKFLQWSGSAYILANQTWRGIKVDNVNFLADNISTALNLVAGANITLTRGTSGKVTIASADIITDYGDLSGKPSINDIPLVGDLTSSDLGLDSEFLPLHGGALSGRLTINDQYSTKPLILNTRYSGAVSTRVDFQVQNVDVGNFEYSLDTARFKLFISDGKTNGTGFAIGGTNGDARPYGIPYVVLNNIPQEIWHAGNSGDYTYDWKCKVLYTAGHIVPRTAETYAVGIGSAPFAEVHANRWYPNKNDTTHYIEYVSGHWYIHGDAVCDGELCGGQITVSAV